LELNEYQKAAVSTRRIPVAPEAKGPIVSLLGLAGEAGELISEYKKFLRDGEAYRPFKERVCEELGDMLWYVASVASEFELNLEVVGRANLAKCHERWGEETSFPQLDAHCPEGQRFPRRFLVAMEPFEEDGQAKVRMLMNGEQMGSPLTDNAHQGDGYRYHDVFHLACAATLGWSPVTRALFRPFALKRKFDPRVDEVEDGGRAIAIEEGISALVFSYAMDRSHLAGIEAIDYDLLRTIKGMTRGLEVSIRTVRDWERTILTTYKVWRELQRREGGVLLCDLDAREIAITG